MNPKPAPDDGYNVSVDEHALPWTFQGETDADTVIMSRRVGSMGLSGDKKGPSRRGVGGTKWNVDFVGSSALHTYIGGSQPSPFACSHRWQSIKNASGLHRSRPSSQLGMHLASMSTIPGNVLRTNLTPQKKILPDFDL